MTKYEYFEKIANNWSVQKRPLPNGAVDIYLTTPALSLVKKPDVLLDDNGELYKEYFADDILRHIQICTRSERSTNDMCYYGQASW